MKKLNKTQKQLIKKRLLKVLNISALIIGGLSFAFVLYALVFGGSSNEQSEVEHTPIPKINNALPPPADYDVVLKSYPYTKGDHVFASSKDFDNVLLSPLIWTYNSSISGYDLKNSYFAGYELFDYVYLDIELYDVDNNISQDGYAYTNDMPLGRDTRSTANNPMKIVILNDSYSPIDIQFDMSTTSANYTYSYPSLIYDNKTYTLGINLISKSALFSFVVMPLSRLSITFAPTINNLYIDAIYFNSLASIGYEDGFDVGYGDGFDEGSDLGYDVGYGDGYEVGNSDGYADGYQDGQVSVGAFENVFDLIYSGAESVDKILSISVFGNVTLGLLLFVPLVFTIILAVVKVIKG